MRYDLDQVPEPIAYKLLAATTIPRPIAWVVTKARDGGLNAAPYSFFNVMGSAPPTLALGLMADPRRGFKDTALNILETGEFVVNLVPERLVQQMNLTAADAPRGVDELALAGLATLPSTHVAPPRIAESPVSYECVALSSVVTGPCQTVVIGRVLAVHVEDRFLLSPERAHVDTNALDLVARSYGSDYIRTHDNFRLDRPSWAGLVATGRDKP
jgi:flavin reductase (DIM6/NTAB) family NADH-FMN oxidoreductase RutF